jgi:hypothetical protein
LSCDRYRATILVITLCHTLAIRSTSRYLNARQCGYSAK